MTLPVFIDREITAGLGDAVILGGSEGHHGASVMRLQPGEHFQVVNGGGARWTLEVTEVVPEGLAALVLSFETEEKPLPEIILAQALSKGGRDEMAVEICTELGVDRIIPWQADRSIVRWSGAKVERGVTKWQNVAWKAAKQSRRAFLPTVLPLVTSKELAATIAEPGTCGVIAHEEAETRLSTVLGEDSAAERIIFVVGPEGGITEEELGYFKASGAEVVTLGANVLRASTAGAVCVTIASNLLRGQG